MYYHYQIDRERTNAQPVRVVTTDENGATGFLAQIHSKNLPLFTITIWGADEDCDNADHWELEATLAADAFMADFAPNARTLGALGVGDVVTTRTVPVKMDRRWIIDRKFTEKVWLRVLWDDGTTGSLLKGTPINTLLKLPPVRIGEENFRCKK